MSIYNGRGEWVPVRPSMNTHKKISLPIRDNRYLYSDAADKILGTPENDNVAVVEAMWDPREGPTIITPNGARWLWNKGFNMETFMMYWNRLVDGNNIDNLIIYEYGSHTLVLSNISTRKDGRVIRLYDDDEIFMYFELQERTMEGHSIALHGIIERLYDALVGINGWYKQSINLDTLLRIVAEVKSMRTRMTPEEIERDENLYHEAATSWRKAQQQGLIPMGCSME